MICEDIDKTNCPSVTVYAPCETLTCRFCGSEYPSRGKRDPGYCRECEHKMQNTFIFQSGGENKNDEIRSD